MRLDKVGSVAVPGSKTLTKDLAVILALLITGLFIADCISPVAARAAGEQLIHNSANTGSGKYGTWGAEYTCATCHSKSVKNNIKYVNYSIVTPGGKKRPVVFNRYTATSNAVTGVFGNDERSVYKDSSRNVCEVCHHKTIYHNYSTTKLVSTGNTLTHPEHKSNKKDCNTCHKHNLGYRPPQAGLCTDCHGVPPTNPSGLVSNALGPTPPADAGAHATHRSKEGMECSTCHNNFGHGLLGNSMIEMGFRIDKKTWTAFSGISTVMSGTITATNNSSFNNNFSVAPNNPGTVLNRSTAWGATCSVYCHGDGWAVPSGKASSLPISWTNGPLGSCSANACHGTTSANPPNPGVVGAHKRHVGDLQLACTKCHQDYASPHMINGRVTWDLTNQGSNATYKGYRNHSTASLPGTAAYGDCTNIYCHSNIQPNGGSGAPDAYKTITWGSSVLLNCDGCHGGKPNAVPAQTPIQSGAHTKHTAIYPYSCSACHNGYGADGSLMNHLNNNIEVVFNSYSGNYTQMPVNRPGDGYGNCSANYCHSDGKGNKKVVSWATAGPLPCNTCHKDDQPGNAIATGKHTAHVDNINPLFSAAPFPCVTCHANTVVDNSHIAANPSKHVNKFADYSGVRASRYTRSTGACTSSYCHNDGKGNAPAVAVKWNDGSTITDCKGCHGDSPGGTFVSAVGEPNYANTGMDTTYANSHDKHMGGIGMTTCVYCHNDTVSATGLKAATLHLNGMKNIAPGGGKAFTYLGNRTCSNISCHGGPAQAKWGQSFPIDCTGCHGNNALSFAPISSGKHKLHINNKNFLGKNYPCATCHALTANPSDRSIADTSVHGNGFKNYTGPIAGGRGSYVTATGVCSASYCHTDGKGIRNQTFTSLNGWKSSQMTLGCIGCHGNSSPADFTSTYGEPNYSSTGAGAVRANDHKNHADNGKYSCSFCHAKTVDANGAIFASNSTHILNRKIDVQAGNGKSFGYDEGTKTCSGISCHGGKGTFSKVWGAPVTSDCTGCHGNNYLSFAPISSGRHKSHISNAATLGVYYNCTECHAKTINSDERSFADRTKHGNGYVDYSGAKAGKLYDPLQGNCSNTYCHSDGKGSVRTFTSANGWNSKTVYSNCIGCHGNDTAQEFASTAGEPNYVSQTAGSLRANSHKVHVGSNGSATCYYCHADVVGVAGNTVNARHINRFVTYSTSGTAGKTFSRGAGRTCSNIACHGVTAVTATWGGTIGCAGCHGGNAGTAPSDIKTGKHTAHINNPDLGNTFGCAACHAQVVNGDTSFSNRSRHADGYVNYSGAMAGKNKAACNTAYCHSNGKGTPGNAVDWVTGSAFVNCVGCHGTATGAGTFPSQAGEPNYANSGAAGSATSNSHQTHTTSLVLRGAASCEICHINTVTTAGTQIKVNSLHLDKSIDVFFDSAQAGSASYDKINRTCNNTVCHGTPAPKWGDAASVSCKTCHANLMSSGAHAAHVGSDLWSTNFATMYNYTSNNSAGIMYRYGCANCHPVVSTGNHRNGTYGDIDLSSNATGIGALRKLNKQILSAGGGYTKNGTTSFTCDLVYCHSDGSNTTSPIYKQSPNWYGGAFTGNKCGMCHDNPPRYAGQSHYVATSSMGKESGHMIGIHYRNNSKGNNLNGFLGYSSSGSKAHGNSGLATTISCNTCHSGIVSGTKIDTYAMSGTGSIFNCGTCHKTNSRTPLQTGEIANTALHINGAKNVAFAPIDFKTKAQLSNVANALGWSRHSNYKADDSYDTADLRVSTWDAQTKTCLTACHVNQPNITWGGQLHCVSCHANQ